MTTNKPNYTRDTIIHLIVIVVCSLLIVGAFFHPVTRAAFFWGLHVITYNVSIWWHGIIDLVTF